MSIDDLSWDASGLLPVVVQSARDGVVLTLAYANREALQRTLDERTTWLFSRSRQALWKKGESSGNTQRVLGVAYDCDADALLYTVDARGPACHTGTRSCFSGSLLDRPQQQPAAPSADGSFERAIAHLRATIAARRGAAPESGYTAKLLHDGIDRIAKKVGEEATEVVIAAKNADRAEIAWEVADLLFHTLVLLEDRGVSLDDVGTELLRRAK